MLIAKDDIARLNFYREGLSDRRIAAELGETRSAVYEWRRRNGLAANYQFVTLSKPDSIQRIQLYEAGYSDRQIARLQGVTRLAILDWRHRRKLHRNFEPWRARREGPITPARSTVEVRSVAEVSLDAPSPSGKAWVDNLRDDSWSNWLEEMGATVW